jgi:hypothetical protein
LLILALLIAIIIPSYQAVDAVAVTKRSR